ncbi:MAG: transcription antitermination factor NusB [Planctomycetota bacterium]
MNPAESSAGQTVVRRRTRARELALRALYLIDIRGPGIRTEVADYLEAEADGPEVLSFARALVEGVSLQREKIDEQIASVAENWEIHRMAVVDRNILRLGTYELMCLPDVPPKVAINEAIDLAKRYSTADSGGFVNGILDKLRADLGR